MPKRPTTTDRLGRERSATRADWGKIRRLASGNYSASYEVNGTRYFAPRTFTARLDATAWLAARRTELERGEWQPPQAHAEAVALATETLGEYADRWLTTNTNRRGEPLRPRTVDEYRRLLNGPLKPLTGLPLTGIRPNHIDDWYAAQARTGRLTQASRGYSLAATILAHAVERGRIPTNPAHVRGAQTARTGRRVEPPTDAQLDTILANVPLEYVALVWVAAEGGLRWGEATELRRLDVRIDHDDTGRPLRALVLVSRGVVRTSDGFTVGPPKSAAGVRDLYIYGSAAVALADHLHDRVGRFGNPLLFPSPADPGKHLPQSTFHPHWAKARAAADRPDLPFHALRHRAGTAYVQHGATMAEAMRRLGHTSLKVAARYQHDTGRDAEIAERMSRQTS